MSAVRVEIGNGIGTVVMDRPDRHNAFDEHVIAELTAGFARLGADDAVRAVVLRGAGKSFSAGADLDWMRRMAAYDEAANLADAQGLAALMRTIDTLPKPTVALVHGAAYGGGVGLVACCDIAIATEAAAFSLSEVKLGLIPAVISPYVVRAIGVRAARRYFLTAERFDAVEARRLGLVHELAASDGLEEAARQVLAALRGNGPTAVRAAKDLVAAVAGRAPAEVEDDCARRIAGIRAGGEGKEGVAAFLEKRKPSWLG
ncbi:enoyl-CoA hydratase/isomerase family protein [Mycobacterium sp. KBS0706]|uniref:enoyl-CoA hydratase/isomerase family protein n=1 Tax=Mycobacterium sp. KBS0706 TaxID=2578109 RepID=UPI00110FE717|nr:enoyl-CoA hydratase/isomerase family protein [Mycobacterium sp. KBS0706]TSD86660.1 enoyl-CoA hydratase/isomerase family protein [Mycobacterium sp. KBS0706]